MELENRDRGTTISDVRPVTDFLGKLRGLMFEEDGRILMQFNQEKQYTLWMPFVKAPLDAAFINRNEEIVHIERGMQPLTLNPETWNRYRSEAPCCHILEVEAGLLEEKEWSAGDQLSF